MAVGAIPVSAKTIRRGESSLHFNVLTMILTLLTVRTLGFCESLVKVFFAVGLQFQSKRREEGR